MIGVCVKMKWNRQSRPHWEQQQGSEIDANWQQQIHSSHSCDRQRSEEVSDETESVILLCTFWNDPAEAGVDYVFFPLPYSFIGIPIFVASDYLHSALNDFNVSYLQVA